MAKLLLIISTLLCFSTLIANSTIIIKPKPILRVYQFIAAEEGPNPTSYEVARSSISTTPASFGIVYVEDNVLRAGPDPNSQILGRNQGTSVTTGLTGEPSVVINYNFGFTAGKYEGSSLIVAGQRLFFVPNQEIPLAGGTGVFHGCKDTPFPALSLSIQPHLLLSFNLIYIWIEVVCLELHSRWLK